MAMIVQYSVKYILAVTIGKIIGVYVIQGVLHPSQPCHFRTVGLKI